MLANCVEASDSTAIRDAAVAGQLPAAAASSPSLKPCEAAGKTTAHGRLLVTDDNPLNLDVAARILQGMGHEVVTAESGAAALDHLAQGRFDIVFMDCEMPDMDGIAATRLARQAEKARSLNCETTQPVPIIALPAHSADEIHERCMAAGMDGFITKPLTKKKLQEALDRWLHGPTAARSAGACDAIELVTSPGPSEHVPAVDASVLTSLMAARPGDAAEFLARLVARFEELATRQIAQLWQAYEEGRSDEAGGLAHGLKSSAGAIGARQVASRAGQIEQHVKNHGLTGLEPILAPLGGDLAAAMNGLSKFCGAAG